LTALSFGSPGGLDRVAVNNLLVGSGFTLSAINKTTRAIIRDATLLPHMDSVPARGVRLPIID
jgi:hypothetical protein